MVALAFGVLWLGYQQIIFGYTMMKGYDVTWMQLANPVDPYQWPAKGQPVPPVPKGQVFPSSSSATSSAAATGSGKARVQRVIPGHNAA